MVIAVTSVPSFNTGCGLLGLGSFVRLAGGHCPLVCSTFGVCAREKCGVCDRVNVFLVS